MATMASDGVFTLSKSVIHSHVSVKFRLTWFYLSFNRFSSLHQFWCNLQQWFMLKEKKYR